MKNILRKLATPVACLFLLLWVVASIASASDFGPRRRPGHRGRPGPIHSVAEPAAIVLLGAGLVSLGVYAKKKRGKKQ
jgi:hypothetical protein